LKYNVEDQIMKKTILSAFALTAALTASMAFAGSCPMDMKQVDAAMATSTLNMADMEKVKALRAEGEAMHKSGDHAASVEALKKAKALLKI
jgi:hypothetical protein